MLELENIHFLQNNVSITMHGWHIESRSKEGITHEALQSCHTMQCYNSSYNIHNQSATLLHVCSYRIITKAPLLHVNETSLSVLGIVLLYKPHIIQKFPCTLATYSTGHKLLLSNRGCTARLAAKFHKKAEIAVVSEPSTKSY